MSTTKVTISDVAKTAGVSIGAVSRILNNDPTIVVREETRKAVHKAIAKLGYSPNPNARSLRISRTNSLAMVLPEINSPAFAAIIQGAQRAASDRGYSMLLGGVGADGDDPELPAKILKKNRVDGFLISTGLKEAESLATLKSLGAPAVLLNRYLDKSQPHVVLDDEGGVRSIVDYLVKLGHKRIGFLGSSERFLGSRRLAGYKKALRDADIPYDSKLVIDSGYTKQGGERAANTILSLRNRPTAIFATNHLVAAGVIKEAAIRNISVPQQLSVASFYDGPVAEIIHPSLTAIQFPLEELGSTAVNMLIDLVEGKKIHSKKITLAYERLIVRESTAVAPY